MVTEAIRIISGVVSGYFWFLMLYVGVICFLFEAHYMKSGDFKREERIAKWGGAVYVIGGTLLFLIVSIFW